MEPLRTGRYTAAEFAFYLDMHLRLQNKQPLKYDLTEIAKGVEFHGDIRYLEHKIEAANAAELSFVAKYLLDTVGGPNAIVLLVSVIKHDVHAHVEVGERIKRVYHPMSILEAMRQAGEDVVIRSRGQGPDEIKRLLVDSHFRSARLKILGRMDPVH
jgi:hypothetical protein